MSPERVACLDLPAFPLQLLLRREPSWSAHPAVVVTEDRPQGIVLWSNRRARAARVLPGMRYAAALSLAAGLRAGVVAPAEITRAVDDIAEVCRAFSPNVEPSRLEPGVFRIDAGGLGRLLETGQYGGRELVHWARALRDAMVSRGLFATVIVGFDAFRTYALARALRGVRVFAAAPVGIDEEIRLVRAVPLGSLGPHGGLPPATRDALDLLGVRTLGALMRLPPLGLRERHGPEAERLWRRVMGDVFEPLAPEHPPPPLLAEREVEPPDTDSDRLLFGAKGLLHPLMVALHARGEALARLHVRLTLERAPPVLTALSPAEPSLDEAQITDLLRLKLESLALAGAVKWMALEAEGTRAPPGQAALPRLRGARDLEAGTRAISRLRAAFGDNAVVHATLRPNHLPEARFAWEPLTALREPHAPPQPESRPLIRRVFPKAMPLPHRPRHEPDGWLLRDWTQGPVVRLWGPFRLTGGWWVREVRRDYYYAETERGDLLWLYHDAVRRRWFLQGVVD